MKIEKQIQKWLDTGIINQDQARTMLSDVSHDSREERSNNFIVTISTIGTILLGLGAVLFVASNWKVISDPIKVLILVGSTFTAYSLGYLFQYHKKNLPKVGAALLFLGALLFGASTFLIAQIYHVNANSHALVLFWLLGILPLVYAFNSVSIAGLSSLLYFIWIGLYFFRNSAFDPSILISFPVIYLVAGSLLFSIGGLHYFGPYLAPIARIFRLVGLKIAMFSLFLLTFKFFSTPPDQSIFGYSKEVVGLMIQVQSAVVLFSILAILALAINIFFNPSNAKTNLPENATAIGVIIFSLLFFMFPAQSGIYTAFYNLLYAGLTLIILFIGYQRADIKIVDIGTFSLAAFLLVKYFDFFWSLLDRSLFFLVGGLILVLGGVAMERKRRQIKHEFTNKNSLKNA
jgi:uncharacterized membrane protein